MPENSDAQGQIQTICLSHLLQLSNTVLPLKGLQAIINGIGIPSHAPHISSVDKVPQTYVLT